MRLLVVGGAGYIGSVTAEVLLARGHEVAILDALTTGHRAAVPSGTAFVQGDLGDARALAAIFRRAHFDGVLHFAAHSIVPDSMEQPGLYFANNVAGVVTLVNTMLEHGVRRLVFSSSAAVYGEPDLVPIPEDAPVRPDSPYGESKAIVERMLAWYAASAGLQYAALRYFNAAGASERLGEDHQPETHLIPLALQSALGQREGLTVFGTDYCTPDGTAVRDYVHVLDLAEAHARAIERLDEGNLLCNLGNEVGYSVRQVLDTVQAATGRGLTITQGPRRPGDAPITVADTARARAALGWQPRYGLREMVESAWRWRLAHPNGYAPA